MEKRGRVYFAAPLFCNGEREYNAKICAVLEENGYSVYLPQRDGNEALSFVGMTEEQKGVWFFDKDIEELKKADVLFINLDGRVPDEGACVELGFAFASGKRCYGFKTDLRTAERGLSLNPMISGCLKEILTDDGRGLEEVLCEYLKKNIL